MIRIDMSSREWAELIKPVLPHVSSDKEQPELQVVRLEPRGRALYAVATDRHTLAAERWPLPPSEWGDRGTQVVHVSAREAAATLRLFTYSKDEDPPLRIMIDKAPLPVRVAGAATVIEHLAVTVEHTGGGTRVVLHDERDPSRDPLAGWRKLITEAMTRPDGRALDGLDVLGWQLGRWGSAARKGERLTLYSGPKPGDPLLVTVEKHFAGILALQHFLDAPAKTRADLPWAAELGGVDGATGEKLEAG